MRQIKGDFVSMENKEATGSGAAVSGIHQVIEASLVSSFVWRGVNSRE